MSEQLAAIISGERVCPGERLEQRVRSIAGGLVAHGLGVGDVLCILMRNDFPFIELTLAAERVGVVAVPVNWHASVEDIEHILHDSGARLVVAHTDLLTKLPARALDVGLTVLHVAPPPEIRCAYKLGDGDFAVLQGIQDYEVWLSEAQPLDTAIAAPPYRLLYTSGSTGRPKGVRRELADRDVTKVMGLRTRKAHGMNEGPIRAVMTGPLYHSAPNAYAMNCVRAGGLLVLQPRFDASQLLALIGRHRISHMHVVPTMFNRLLALPQAERAQADVSSLRSVAHGAAMCPRDVKRAMIDWWGEVLYEYYAATELGIIAACTSSEWLAHPGTVGRPPTGVDLRIVDDLGQELPDGEAGEILVQSSVVGTVSYHNRPDAMSDLRRDGHWATLGDIGYRDKDGFVWLCDRKSDMLISGGVNIFPAEVEQLVLQIPGVKDCIAFGVPHADLGEALALYIEPATGATLEVKDIRARILRELGRLKVPGDIRLIDELPREDTGKLARRKIKAAYLKEKTPAK